MSAIDLSKVEAAFNQDADEAEAAVLKAWRAHLKKHPVKGDGPDLKRARAALQQQHGGPGPHKSGSTQEVHGSWDVTWIAEHGADFLVRYEIEDLPESHLDGLERIGFEDGRLIPSVSAATNEVVEAYGTYDPRARAIRLASNADNIAVFGGATVIHEIGHHVHLARMTDEGVAEWARISRGGQAASISAYARTNQGEHFAEAYREYFRDANHRRKLKNLEPASYKFMRNLNKYLLPIGQAANVSGWENRYHGG
jgi:hypothetical protein